MVSTTYKKADDISIPNIKAERQYTDGVHTAYRLTPNPGYSMYDTEVDAETVTDPDSGEEKTAIYYHKTAVIPKIKPPEKWTYIAVPETPETLENTY